MTEESPKVIKTSKDQLMARLAELAQLTQDFHAVRLSALESLRRNRGELDRVTALYSDLEQKALQVISASENLILEATANFQAVAKAIITTNKEHGQANTT